VPLLIGIPVAYGIASTLVAFVSNENPDLRYDVTANSDAQALYLGENIYRDPADGYTGQLYTPLFPALVGLLHRVQLWAGWSVTVNLLATVALAGLAAWLAYPRGEGSAVRRGFALAGAAGVGLLAWWFVDCLRFSLLYEGRADHLAWAFSLTGLVVLAHRGTESRRALAVAVVLLSAGFWTKQTTVTVSLVAVVWTGALAALGLVPRRTFAGLAAGLVVVNGLVMAIVNLATDGWQYYFAFELGRRQPKFAEYVPSLHELLRVTGIALGACALVGAAALANAWTAARERPGPRGSNRGDARIASVLVAFIVLSAPLAVYFRTKVGADVNSYIGLAWALGLLFALAYRHAQSSAGTALVAAACVAALFVVAVRPGYNLGSLTVAALGEKGGYEKLSPEVVAYARSHIVWEQTYANLNVEPQRSIYPNFFNITDLLAAGRQPIYLVNALLDRRFDAVAPIRFADDQTYRYWDYYMSGVKAHEANYTWKLNQVIKSGYGPQQAPVLGLLERSPGPPRSPWMRHCFGPFELAGKSFDIRRGGGFWCASGTDGLTLRRTPARFSEVHAEGVDSIAGELKVTLPGRADWFTLSLEQDGRPGWVMKGRAREDVLYLSLVSGDLEESAQVRLGEDRTVALTFARSVRPALGSGSARREVRVALPEVAANDLSLKGSRTSGVRFDLEGVSLTGERPGSG
jgi:hypothetical protein